MVGDVIAPPLPLLPVLPSARHSLAELAEQNCAGTISARGETSGFAEMGEEGRFFSQTLQGKVFASLCHRSRNLPQGQARR